MSGKGKAWTDEEIGFVEANIDRPVSEVAAELGRSMDSIYRVRSKMKRGYAGAEANISWSEDELSILEKISGTMTARQMCKYLPGRTSGAINRQRYKLGLAEPGLHPGDRFNPHYIGSRPLIAKTCSLCGEMVSGARFGWNSTNRRWLSQCRWCESKRVADSPSRKKGLDRESPAYGRYGKICQAISLKSAQRIGDEYTEKDEQVLADPNLTVLEKALALSRSYAGTITALHRRGIKSHVFLGDPERDHWKLHNPSVACEECGKNDLALIEAISAGTEELNSSADSDSITRPSWDWDDSDLKVSA